MDGPDALVDVGQVQRANVETDPVVWYPTEWGDFASHEWVVLFLKRREAIVDNPIQYTRVRFSQFVHLADTTGDCEGRGHGYFYRIR